MSPDAAMSQTMFQAAVALHEYEDLKVRHRSKLAEELAAKATRWKLMGTGRDLRPAARREKHPAGAGDKLPDGTPANEAAAKLARETAAERRKRRDERRKNRRER